ncbi:unnamed protein product, partial [marine sediment metagenome]
KTLESVEALAKSFIETKAMQGNSIRMAGPDASPEAKAEIYQKVMRHMPELVLKPNPDSAEQSTEFHRMMGVPEDGTGYSVEGVEGLNDDVLNELKALALDTNMTKAQFKKYASKMAEMQGFTNQQKEDSRTRMGAELKTEWGMAFEDRYAVVEKHLRENPGLGMIENMSPDQIKAHYEVSRGLNGVKQAYNQPTASAIMTPAEAAAQVKEIDNNPSFWSLEPADRQLQNTLKIKRIELMRIANPEKYG